MYGHLGARLSSEHQNLINVESDLRFGLVGSGRNSDLRELARQTGFCLSLVIPGKPCQICLHIWDLRRILTPSVVPGLFRKVSHFRKSDLVKPLKSSPNSWNRIVNRIESQIFEHTRNNPKWPKFLHSNNVIMSNGTTDDGNLYAASARRTFVGSLRWKWDLWKHTDTHASSWENCTRISTRKHTRASTLHVAVRILRKTLGYFPLQKMYNLVISKQIISSCNTLHFATILGAQ